MKVNLSILLFFTIFIAQAQIRFEPGYFVDSSGNRVECLIRNVDWKNSPKEFEYKLSGEGELQKGNLVTVNEFGIGDEIKFVKKTVEMDRSSDLAQSLKENSNPVFKTEILFLKVLVEGKANLYQYTEENLYRYFYDMEDGEIKQLVYKRYLITGNKIAKNEQFKRQIWKDLQCTEISKTEVENLDYNRNSLTKVFLNYNQCENSTTKDFKRKTKGDFNINIRPRLNSSSLSVNSSTLSDRSFDFGNETGFSVGLEVEYVLPFNKSKWAIFTEGTFGNFKQEITTNADNVSGGELTSKVDYKYIDIPIGVRHYFFLSDNSKLFIDAAYVVSMSSGNLELKRANGTDYNNLKLDANHNNFSFGMGYKFMDRFIGQFRINLKRDILSTYENWNSSYNSMSFILGYTVF